jgi:hypothetical protein
VLKHYYHNQVLLNKPHQRELSSFFFDFGKEIILFSTTTQSRTIVNNTQAPTRARRSTSPPSESNSSSSSTTTSENPRKQAFDFSLPTTLNGNKSVIKKSTDIIPPPLTNFNNNSTNDEDEDTTSSLFSKRNATPAALNHLKNIEDIIRSDDTPRTRTKLSNNGNKDIPIEYDDESISQISSIDDITVDKASPSPSAHMDFFEDL